MRRVFQPTLNPLQAADQTVQQTGTDTIQYVSPAVQQYHLSAAKAWAHVLMSGITPILMTGYNVATVSGPTTGMVNMAFTNPMASAFYHANAVIIHTSGSTNAAAQIGSISTSGNLVIFVKNGSGSLTSIFTGLMIEVNGLSS